ncbi:MAG: cupredoxin domain-containing protein [Candidatus Micrarchaeota archaeon]
MDKSIIAIGILVVLITIGGIYATSGSSQSEGTTNSTPLVVTGNQTITLGYGSNGYYTPKEIRTTVGTKLTIIGDTNTLRGCMQTVVIGGYGITKRMVPGDNIIEFVADKPGTYSITCTMGMGGGKLIVEDQNGNAPIVESAPITGGTCGGGCGGCGG